MINDKNKEGAQVKAQKDSSDGESHVMISKVEAETEEGKLS